MRLRTPDARPADWLVVGALLLVTEFEIWIEPVFQTGLPGPRPPLAVLAVVAIVPLLWRRQSPLTVLAIMLVGLLLVGVIGDPEQAAFGLVLALLIGVYSVASYGATRVALVGVAATLVGGSVYSWLTWVEGDALVDVIVPQLFIVGSWIAGREFNHLHGRTAELAERASLQERARESEAQIAVAEERTRIARELHDVVAHSISIMGLHAAAARRALKQDAGAAEESLLIVERTSRDAQEEMKRMLGMLRRDGSRGDITPIPALSRLTELIEEVKRTGLGVSLDVEGRARLLPQGLELSAYRIIQEALTNARRHGGSNVAVAVAYGETSLDLTIRDDGSGASGQPVPGHGIIGMRERVSLHGGELYVGNDDGGGFVVRALLPIEATG
ncbi:MAG: sensor histidine kinase [Actinobacteria bacterium]|nr:sensor histidine kinase [Actinomycetota bacterium]